MILTWVFLRDLALTLARNPLLSLLSALVPLLLSAPFLTIIHTFQLHFTLYDQIISIVLFFVAIVLAIAWHRQVLNGPSRLPFWQLFHRPPLWTYLLHGSKVIIPVATVYIGAVALMSVSNLTLRLLTIDTFVNPIEIVPRVTSFFSFTLLGFGFVAASNGHPLGFFNGLKAGGRYAVFFFVIIAAIETLFSLVRMNLLPFAADPTSWNFLIVYSAKRISLAMSASLYAILLALAYMHWLEKEEPKRLAGVFE